MIQTCFPLRGPRQDPSGAEDKRACKSDCGISFSTLTFSYFRSSVNVFHVYRFRQMCVCDFSFSTLKYEDPQSFSQALSSLMVEPGGAVRVNVLCMP